MPAVSAIHTTSLLASAVAALGHLLFALAAGRAGGRVPRAFASVALALSAWSAAVFLDDRFESVGLEVPWLVAFAIPPLGLRLAARVHGSAPRLERFASLSWILSLAAALALGWFGHDLVLAAAFVLYPFLGLALLILRWAFRSRGKSAHGFVFAASLTVAASVVDTVHVYHPALQLPRMAALASLVLVAQLGSSVARHRLFALKPLLGRTATVAIVALGVAELLAELLSRVQAPWESRALAVLVLVIFALLQGPLLRSLRSPGARARARRRKELLRRLERLDDLLASAASIETLERKLGAALQREPELASAHVELGRAASHPIPADDELLLPLRMRGRQHGALLLRLRDPQLLRSRVVRRALRSLAARVALTASTLRRQEERRRTERLAHLGALAASLAHEIKNPLGAILGALELLDPVAGPDQRRWLEILRQESQRLDRTVTDALALGRAPKLETRRVAPRDVAEGARMLAQERAIQSRVALSLRELADGVQPVDLDAEQLRHALLNLLLNAISVQPDGGRVELAVERRSGAVDFHVRDDGPGIAPDLRTKVFEPFFSTRPAGSGIGLAVAQRVAAAHGGRLRIAAPDEGFRGAHFVLTIPVDEGAIDAT